MDEEEFTRPGVKDVIPAVCSFSAVYNVHKTVKRKYTAKRNADKHSMSHLSYFTLWWRRMEVDERCQEVEDEGGGRGDGDQEEAEHLCEGRERIICE